MVGPLEQRSAATAGKGNSNSSILSRVPDLRRSIERRSIRDIACEKIALQIASGVIQVGDQLPSERELAVAFGVSRETIRGALQTLSQRGIVDISHGSRTRVVSNDIGGLEIGITKSRGINSYDIEEVHAARLLVELRVVGDAAERIDRKAIAFLDKSLAEQASTLNDPVRFLICNHEFHTAIYEAGRNRLLADFVADLDTYVMDHRRRVMIQPGAIAQSYREHQAVVEALRRHDRDAAVAAFKQHLDRIYETTKTLMEEERRSKKRSAAAEARTGRSQRGPR